MSAVTHMKLLVVRPTVRALFHTHVCLSASADLYFKAARLELHVQAMDCASGWSRQPV